jgi:hypothetical protein
VVIALALFLALSRGELVAVADLRVGDCLFVRTGFDEPDDQPIGVERNVVEALLAGRAERAACDASHGHEVSAIVELTLFDSPSTEAQATCADEFAGYVGRPATESVYVTLAALPSPAAQAGGATRAICLVARADGQWMDHPARNSGE